MKYHYWNEIRRALHKDLTSNVVLS